MPESASPPASKPRMGQCAAEKRCGRNSSSGNRILSPLTLPTLTPLPAVELYSGRGCGDHIIRLQAARPASWRAAWPDEPRIIQVRDSLTALFRREYRFKADSFLPDDPMGAILALACPGEFDDLVEFIMSVEEELDVKIDDELANKVKTTTTYLQFIEFLLPQLTPEYILRPLVLPGYYFRRGWWPSFRRWLTGGSRHHELRAQQGRRTPDWVEKWIDHEPLIGLRDRAGRILADVLDWPNHIFVPDDQLGALFHHKAGPKRSLAALEALNKEFDLDVPSSLAAAPATTFLDWLRYIREKTEP